MHDESLAMRTESRQQRSNIKAALIVLCAFAVFSGADALVKLLTQTLPVHQVTLMVTLTALVLVIATAVGTRRSRMLWPRYPGTALLRAGLLAGDTILIYYAFSALPLAEAYVLAFLAPVIVAVLALVFLGERLSRQGWLGVLLGFVGVIVALRPGAGMIGLGHAAAIGSAMLFALSIVILRRTKTTESDSALVASLLVVLTVLSSVIAYAAGGFVPIGLGDIATVAVAGLFLFSGHVLLVRAFRTGDASVVAPFHYSQIIWGCLYGSLLFGSPIDIQTLAGAAIIIISGWMVLK